MSCTWEKLGHLGREKWGVVHAGGGRMVGDRAETQGQRHQGGGTPVLAHPTPPTPAPHCGQEPRPGSIWHHCTRESRGPCSPAPSLRLGSFRARAVAIAWGERLAGDRTWVFCASARRPDGEYRLPGPRGGGQLWASDGRTALPSSQGDRRPRAESACRAPCVPERRALRSAAHHHHLRPGPAPPGAPPPGGGPLGTHCLILEELGSGQQWTASPSWALATHGQAVFDSS